MGSAAMRDPQKDRRSGEGVRVCAGESRPAAGADLTSPLTIRHTEERLSAPVAHAGTDGTSCTCGRPASQQITVANVRRGSRWVRVWTWACDECGASLDREREIARSR